VRVPAGSTKAISGPDMATTADEPSRETATDISDVSGLLFRNCCKH
jgi:hypothetical protein